MEKIFRGVLKYRHKYKEDMVSWFHRINENPKPKAIFLTCVDSRMLPTRFTQTNPGDMYIARNVGNIMPHAKHFDPSNPFPEPAFLELGVEVVNIRHVVICGHSDCKAMGVLQSLKQGYLLRGIDKKKSLNRENFYLQEACAKCFCGSRI